MGKKIKFNVYGLSAKYFIPFFIIVMITVYCGFMPMAGGVAYKGAEPATSYIMTCLLYTSRYGWSADSPGSR